MITRAVEILRGDGHNVTPRPTTGPRTACAIARESIAAGADLIVVAGGDGTINETAEGMIHSGVPLAILPAGTANVLATELRLGGNWERAVRRIAECRPRRIGVGKLVREGEEPRHFVLMAGIGLDAHIVYRVSAALKARTGKLAYWVAGWTMVGRSLPEFEAVVDGRTVTCSFALAARVRSYGGDFEIAQETTLFDDTFEVVLFEGANAVSYVKYFAAMAINRLRGRSGVTILRAHQLHLWHPKDERVYIQIDGEFAGDLPATITMMPKALILLMPPGYGR